MGKVTSVKKLLLIVLSFLSISCVSRHAYRVSALNNANVAVVGSRSATSTLAPFDLQGSSIRAIDFRDFTYRWYPRWKYMLSRRKEFTLREGRTEVEVPNGSNEPQAFELVNISYGDITGDGAEEAVVTIKMRLLGNAKPYALFVYTLADGAPKLLWVHETGDRADEGLRSIYVSSDGRLVIEQYNADKLISDGEETKVGLCCPKTFTRSYYVWRDSHFQQLSMETLQNEYRDARVLFDSRALKH